MAHTIFWSVEGTLQGKITGHSSSKDGSSSHSPSKGHSSPGGHGLFEIDDFSFDIEQTLNIGSGTSGAGAGKVNFNPFKIKKQTDTASPVFFQQVSPGGSSSSLRGFSAATLSPRDPASGLPTGKRLHKPIVITKELDSASPRLAQALRTNEILRTVKIVVTQEEPGKHHPRRTIVLTNARITGINRVLLHSTNRPGEALALEFEKVEMHSGFLS